VRPHPAGCLEKRWRDAEEVANWPLHAPVAQLDRALPSEGGSQADSGVLEDK